MYIYNLIATVHNLEYRMNFMLPYNRSILMQTDVGIGLLINSLFSNLSLIGKAVIKSWRIIEKLRPSHFTKEIA